MLYIKQEVFLNNLFCVDTFLHNCQVPLYHIKLFLKRLNLICQFLVLFQ